MEIRKVQRSLGITTLYVTHNQAEAFAVSDKVAVMNDGVIIQTGTPEELYENPNSEFVARFVGSGNVFSGVVEEVRSDSILVRTDSYIFKVSGHRLAGSQVFFTVRPEDVRIELAESGMGAAATVQSVTPQVGSSRVVLDFDGNQVVSVVTDATMTSQLRKNGTSRVWFRFEPELAVLIG